MAFGQPSSVPCQPIEPQHCGIMQRTCKTAAEFLSSWDKFGKPRYAICQAERFGNERPLLEEDAWVFSDDLISMMRVVSQWDKSGAKITHSVHREDEIFENSWLQWEVKNFYGCNECDNYQETLSKLHALKDKLTPESVECVDDEFLVAVRDEFLIELFNGGDFSPFTGLDLLNEISSQYLLDWASDDDKAARPDYYRAQKFSGVIFMLSESCGTVTVEFEDANGCWCGGQLTKQQIKSSGIKRDSLLGSRITINGLGEIEEIAGTNVILTAPC